MPVERAIAPLESFHATASTLDLETPLAALLEEFRAGRLADRRREHEGRVIREVLADLTRAWEALFPGFPSLPWRRRSMMWEYHRGKRDAYLRSLTAAAVTDHGETGVIVNPIAVMGRHARFLAEALPDHRVIATDIDPRGDRLYTKLWRWRGRPEQPNFTFRTESVFDPDRSRRADAVVFFGACGALTDASLAYGLDIAAPFLICRSCCHDNIAGNMEVEPRFNGINLFFRWKNRVFAGYRKKDEDLYFSDRYGPGAWPRSRAASALTDANELRAVARHTPDSDICRSLIDLDRCLHLREQGYDVLYREELFFAHRRPPGAPEPQSGTGPA